MKALRYALLMLAALAAVPAHADHGHWRGGVSVYFGPPVWGWYYPGPRYYEYPPVVAVPAAPPVYVEQTSPPPAQNYWYYCERTQTYYPYVKECAEGWVRVAPQPAK